MSQETKQAQAEALAASACALCGQIQDELDRITALKIDNWMVEGFTKVGIADASGLSTTLLALHKITKEKS
ncbi:MAG: hypothetical protein LKI34_02925 [Bifidobacterium tibiigranuli]|jgi:hypothetical protein|uniref:hypothetical protein n=1 Tax=Bifidobacterium tibiigranuli TaxID=2172043 RepID=UPI0026F01277|nr:hypothetical protein [Bifidobacterium tibiigranuli]MCI1673160.1 hypothetical protein [Bifidobacterium tibiigranuli]MCI1713595.1 hypothetical protein [Bifidobacterium tibiigranuli]